MAKNILIVLNYNDFNMCDRLLSKVGRYSSFDKIIVVDNKSTDDSFTKLRECYESDKIEILQTLANKGYAAGNNFGAFYAINKYQPEILYIANPDVLFEERVVNELSLSLKKDDQYAVIAPLVEKGYNVWNQPAFWGTIESLFLIIFNLHKRHIKKRLLNRNRLQEVGVVEGSFFAIKPEIFRKIGGFDEKTFLYYEENILGYKLKKLGYKTLVRPDLFYEHLHSKSIKKVYKSKAKAFLNFYPSVSLYLEQYLEVKWHKKAMFFVFYKLAYLERKLYDLICLYFPLNR